MHLWVGLRRPLPRARTREQGTAITIRTKLTLALAGLALVPLAIISAGAYAYARGAIERSVLNHLESVVTTQKHRIEAVLRAHERMLAVAASSDVIDRATGRFTPASPPAAREDVQHLLTQWKIRYPAFRNLAVIGGDGQVVAATDLDRFRTGPPPLYSPPGVAAVLAGPTEPTATHVDGQLDHGIVVFAPWSAVYMRAGPLLAELDLEDLSRITLDYTGMGQTGETVLARRDGEGDALYLTPLRFDARAALRRSAPREDRLVAITRALRADQGVFVDTVDYRGAPVFAATAYLPDEDWGIVVKIDRAEAFAPLRRLAQGLIAVFLITAAGVLAVGYFFTDRISGPITRLTRVAEAIDRGDLSQRVTVSSSDEIGVLGHAFNRMTAYLLSANTQLEERVRDRTTALEREMVERARAERRFQLAFEEGPEPMVMVDARGGIVLTNKQLQRVFGYTRDELARRNVEMIFPPRMRKTLRGLRDQILADAAIGRVETALHLVGLAKNGNEMPIDVGLSLVQTREGPLVLAVIRDLRERQRAEAAQALLAAVVDSADDAIFSVDRDTVVTAWNAGAERLYGYRAEEIVGRPVSIIFPPEEAEAELEVIRSLMDERRAMYHEARLRHKDGTMIDVSLARSPIRTNTGDVLGLSTIARDITARKQAEDAVRASLHEKEVLLKEIHHRVKNNLQIVTSLLSLQAGGVSDPTMAALMRETQHRVKSMALMHETLYRSGNLAALDLRPYVHELVQYLRHSYGPMLRRVTLQEDVEPLPLPIDSAIPCGLMLTELVSNAFKHAFPDSREGTLRIEGRHEDSDAYVLRVVDDGRGIPPEVDPMRSRSLGLQLVTNLARQLDAEFTRDAVDRGTSFTIRFRTPPVGHTAAPRDAEP